MDIGMQPGQMVPFAVLVLVLLTGMEFAKWLVQRTLETRTKPANGSRREERDWLLTTMQTAGRVEEELVKIREALQSIEKNPAHCYFSPAKGPLPGPSDKR